MSNTHNPKTISELLQFCSEKQLPLRSMRFFIGEDYPEAKAFGIYQDADGDFVVYKNKADGSRAVRYKGPDEARAVSEIFAKLKSEISLRKPSGRSSAGKGRQGCDPRPEPYRYGEAAAAKRKKARIIEGAILLAMIAVLIVLIVKKSSGSTPKRGYYRSNDDYYYYDTDNWYFFSDLGWDIIDDEDLGFEDYNDRYVSESYSDGYNIGDFAASDWYDGYYERSYDPEASDDDDDWFDDDDWDDDDWDLDFGDWDLGDTDWDTDW